MLFTGASLLLAATSAFAAPAADVTTRGTHAIQLVGMAAYNSTTGNSLMFNLIDSNYPDDTPTDCNLMWSGSQPDERARCNNSKYHVRFPDGLGDIGRFTLEIERVEGENPIPEKGEVYIYDNADKPPAASDTWWHCEQNPKEGINEKCVCTNAFYVYV